MGAAREYDDGLDADGYPISSARGLVYVHGSVAEAGDFKPVKLVDITARVIERVRYACDIGGNCDSPIEVQIGAAIIVFFERAGRPLKLCKTLDTRMAQNELVLVPQYAWSYYRSDWAILNPARHGALLIECDGKDFHSTISQKIHDQKKDEAAMDRGFLTMRFTGSEIFRDADRCAQKIYDAVCGSE
jgi:very-short-patch-repair endonuclease